MAVTIDSIRAAVQTDNWLLSVHARRNAIARTITDQELLHALTGGEILEDYPNDPRGASALVLGFTAASRALHAVCAFDPGGTLLIITVYEPSMPWWRDERTRNR